MELFNVVNRFYYEMALNELKLVNSHAYPDITYNSLLYLDLIAYTEHCTASRLAERLNISKPAVTAKVSELIRQGYVMKTRNDSDKRMHYLTVSEQYWQDCVRYDKRMYRSLEAVEQQFTPQDIATFCNILQTYTERYSEEQHNEQSTGKKL